MGGLSSVGKLVRDAAFSFEDGMYKNCSGYVSEQLRQAVRKAADERSRNAVAA